MNATEPVITILDERAKEYDEWFGKNPAVFDSELAALSRVYVDIRSRKDRTLRVQSSIASSD